MTTLDELKTRLRQSRIELLAAVRELPEVLLQRPGAVGEWSVAQIMAQRIEAENRALTLVQSMLHGRPRLPDLPQAELDRLATLRRRDWDWPQLMRELYQQREETFWNLDDLAGDALTQAVVVGAQSLTPYQVLAELADTEERLAVALRAWRRRQRSEVRRSEVRG